MLARRCAMPQARDLLLIVSVAAILCGLSLSATGLGSPGGSLELAAPDAPNAPVNSLEPGRRQPLAGAEIGSAGMTARTMTHGPSVGPAPCLSVERFSDDAAGGKDRYAIRASDDARTYLARTALARWSYAVTARDETSGYHGKGRNKRLRRAGDEPGSDAILDS